MRSAGGNNFTYEVSENPVLKIRAFLRAMVNRLDAHHVGPEEVGAWENANRWRVPIAYLSLHLGIFAVFWVGWSWFAVITSISSYLLRIFAVTGSYHRYLSHRSYKTSRWFQFAFAFLANTAPQRGPLWWAAHHRHHHRFSDEPDDPHSPLRHGFWTSHLLWWSLRKNRVTRRELVLDLWKFPELVFLNRFDFLAPLSLAVSAYLFGEVLQTAAPGLGASGPQMLVWGFVIPTVALSHGISSVNSLGHLWGRRRFETRDNSRNNFWLALVSLGDGWHNNHHHYPRSARHGFYWWEIDPTYYGLLLLEKMGLIWELKQLPERVKASNRLDIAKPLRP